MLDPETGEAPTPTSRSPRAMRWSARSNRDAQPGGAETGAARQLAFAWTHNTLIPHAKLMRSIELFHTKVLPRVG